MWRSKKFIMVAVLAVVLLAGSIGGVALAQTEDEDIGKPEDLLDRVCAILQAKGHDITSEELKDALMQAGEEMKNEVMGSWLQGLVDQGKLTQEQADGYLDWWGEKPDMPEGFGLGPHRGMRGFGGKAGFGGMRGFGGIRGFAPCVPAE